MRGYSFLQDQVDTIHRYFPQASCPRGSTLAMNQQPTYRHQVFDLPTVRHQVTKHQIYSGSCTACNQQQVTKCPDTVESDQMGAGLISTDIQLSGQFHLSIRQIQAYLSEYLLARLQHSRYQSRAR